MQGITLFFECLLILFLLFFVSKETKKTDSFFDTEF